VQNGIVDQWAYYHFNAVVYRIEEQLILAHETRLRIIPVRNEAITIVHLENHKESVVLVTRAVRPQRFYHFSHLFFLCLPKSMFVFNYFASKKPLDQTL
jgi:hypothetical protein